MFGAWCKWGGGKGGALSVFKDTNGSGAAGAGELRSGARGQRYGERERRRRCIGTAAAALL